MEAALLSFLRLPGSITHGDLISYIPQIFCKHTKIYDQDRHFRRAGVADTRPALRPVTELAPSTPDPIEEHLRMNAFRLTLLVAGVIAAVATSAPSSGAAQTRTCRSITVSRQSPNGPYAEGATLGKIEATGLSCRLARRKLAACVFHRRVAGWSAVAVSDSTQLSQARIEAVMDNAPMMAPLRNERPDTHRYVTFTVAGGRPRCFATAKVVAHGD